MPNDIERELRGLEQSFTNIELGYKDIALRAARARFSYDIAYAKAINELDHRAVPEGGKKPTVPVLEAQAVLMVQDEMEEARIAEAELDIARKTIDSVGSRLSSVQTRSKITQIEMSLAR